MAGKCILSRTNQSKLQFKSTFGLPSNPWIATDYVICLAILNTSYVYSLYVNNVEQGAIKPSGQAISLCSAKPGDEVKLLYSEATTVQDSDKVYVIVGAF